MFQTKKLKRTKALKDEYQIEISKIQSILKKKYSKSARFKILSFWKCEECDSELIEDTSLGEICCMSCGLVYD
jgi:hypothetical protein